MIFGVIARFGVYLNQTNHVALPIHFEKGAADTSCKLPKHATEVVVFTMCKRSEGRLGAHTGSAKISLRALAARKTPQVRHSWCCCAAMNPVIHTVCSKPKAANLTALGYEVLERDFGLERDLIEDTDYA